MPLITSIKHNHLDRFKIKLFVCSELFRSMIRQKDIFELVSVIEVFLTSPFTQHKKSKITFYDFSSFYSRFLRSNDSILSFIHKLHVTIYKREYFSLKSLIYEYETEIIKYREIRKNMKGNVKSIRLTLPIEALMIKISEDLPSIGI